MTTCGETLDTSTTLEERFWKYDEVVCIRAAGHEGWHISESFEGRNVSWISGLAVASTGTP